MVDKIRQRWYYLKVPIRKNKYSIKLVIKKQVITYNKIETEITNFFVLKKAFKIFLKNFKKVLTKKNKRSIMQKFA